MLFNCVNVKKCFWCSVLVFLFIIIINKGIIGKVISNFVLIIGLIENIIVNVKSGVIIVIVCIVWYLNV